MSTTKLTEITDDLFGIASRLKGVNPCYKIFHNPQTDKFEVHDVSRGAGNTLAFVVPYNELDARTVDFAMFTRVENARKVFREVEDHNCKLQREQAYVARQNLLSKAEEVRRAYGA
ncbi:MAG: hypothetical protein NC132_04575 [Corallococcus sp.]|nr:hypothetical protein [Corallococcus sp.]MCM1359661.1 hypothetical protein [Corallococcus sp.]MCM1395370.1 hypothetical protein [Corallococcus sp.]